MGLKGFHIVFVTAAVSLAIFFSLWSFNQYSREKLLVYLVSTIISALAAVGFVVYGVNVYKKIKS